MKNINLTRVEHNIKVGDQPEDSEPTLFGDSLFFDDGVPIGFYIENIQNDKLQKLVDIADHELNSNRVPKSEMKRSSGFMNEDEEVNQYSCILGSIPPKPHMRRPYASKSSVHAVRSARTFVKAMYLAGREAAGLIKNISPELYQSHLDAVYSRVPEQWRFADFFTSSISNCNISCPVHRDNANVKNSLNVIITKRRNAKGGNLYIPDYDLTINSADNSMLVYPAWRNTHGVTPIVPTHAGGYRNTLVWYSLDSFHKY